MKIPDGLTEQDVLNVISKVVRRLASKFKFGYHEIDDIKQQAYIEAHAGLEKYDGIRPLENFIWTHIRNRLFNFKRDNYERPGTPCDSCEFIGGNGCQKHADMIDCEQYNNWVNRNIRKKNIVCPIELGNVCDENEDNMKTYDHVDDDITFREIKKIIDKRLPVDMRGDYVRMLYDVRIPKQRRIEIQEEIIHIVRESEYGEETWGSES